MNIHIGKIIKQYCDEHNITAYVLSQRLHMSFSNVYKMFGRSHISTSCLQSVSQALNHNFFRYYFNDLDNDSMRGQYNSLLSRFNMLQSRFNTMHTAGVSSSAELEKLKVRMQLLEQENTFLKDMVQVLKGRP